MSAFAAGYTREVPMATPQFPCNTFVRLSDAPICATLTSMILMCSYGKPVEPAILRRIEDFRSPSSTLMETSVPAGPHDPAWILRTSVMAMAV